MKENGLMIVLILCLGVSLFFNWQQYDDVNELRDRIANFIPKAVEMSNENERLKAALTANQETGYRMDILKDSLKAIIQNKDPMQPAGKNEMQIYENWKTAPAQDQGQPQVQDINEMRDMNKYKKRNK